MCQLKVMYQFNVDGIDLFKSTENANKLQQFKPIVLCGSMSKAFYGAFYSKVNYESCWSDLIIICLRI